MTNRKKDTIKETTDEKAVKSEENLTNEAIDTEISEKKEIESNLPQNIVLIGERDVNDKKVYISQYAYKAIHKFTKDKTEKESGGILVGEVVEEFGKKNIIVRAFIEAKHCEATPTTLTFTHESWDHIHRVMSKKYSNYKIVGWIHTHPGFGIFLSEYDRFIQDNFFNEDNQIAYVIDPIKKEEGFYCWIKEKIEKCKGFFIFDENDKEIKIETEKSQESEHEQKKNIEPKTFKLIASILIGCLIVCCTVLGIKVNTMEKRIVQCEQINQIIMLSMEQASLENHSSQDEKADNKGNAGNK